MLFRIVLMCCINFECHCSIDGQNRVILTVLEYFYKQNAGKIQFKSKIEFYVVLSSASSE